MVRHFIFSLSLLPALLASGEFIATVEQNQVTLQEGFLLNLTLKDASAKAPPNLNALHQSFHIQAQQQLNNTSIVNGKMSSSLTWKLTLMPKLEGVIEIPALEINSSEGPLFSSSITMHVSKANAQQQPISIATDISNPTPYKNEPVIYTVKLSSSKELSHIQVQKFTVDDALLEAHGEPKVSTKIENGIPIHTAEFNYLITPLKPGLLKIPSTTIQGYLPLKRKTDDFDLFSLMRGNTQMQPFAYATEEAVLEVKPQVNGINPWLPVRALVLEEVLDEKETLQVGEPLTRTLKIKAIGIKTNQLPSLKDSPGSSSFKIYADKPELNDTLQGRELIAERIERFTLIPEKAGTVTLPEISLAYWDTVNNTTAQAIIPSKTLHILPAQEQTPEPKVEAAIQPLLPEQQEHSHSLLYVLIAGLIGLLSGAALWVFMLQRKVKRLLNQIAPKTTYNPFQEDEPPKKGKFSDLNPT